MIPLKDRFYLGIIAVLLLVILSLRMCSGKSSPCPEQGEIVRHDTTWLEHSDSTAWIRPEPTAVIPAKIQHDTIQLVGNTVIKYRDADTGAILQDYFATRYYYDSALTQYGKVWVKDSVSRNRIIRRQWATDFNIPVVTNTLVLPAPHRWQVFAGFSLSGNRQTLLNGFGPQLILKTPRDQIYGIGAQYVAGGQLFYNGSIYFKINFHK